jgi:DNA-binding protein WhiA
VNRPEAAYHLELVSGNFELGNLLYDLLRRMGFPAGFVDRKDSYIVYLKEGDAVIDFLGMMEADEAVESFEVARNVKEVREQVNRLVNCETANLQKAVDAAGRQLDIIRSLEAAGQFRNLPPKVRAAAKARLDNPDATLQELAEMLGISKSGMNHRMRKLKELAATLG